MGRVGRVPSLKTAVRRQLGSTWPVVPWSGRGSIQAGGPGLVS